MKIINENMKVQYKRGLRIETDEYVLRVQLFNHKYRVEGYYKNENLDLIYSNDYNTLSGVANWLKKNFDIDLEWDKEKYGR